MSSYYLCAAKDHYVEQHRGETLKGCPAQLGERTKCGSTLRLAPTAERPCTRCNRGQFVDYEPGVAACSWCGAEKRISTPSDQDFSVTKEGGQHPAPVVTKKRPMTGAERVAAYRARKRAVRPNA